MTTTLISAADLYRRVDHVVPAIEWATMSDDVDAILRLKHERKYWRRTFIWSVFSTKRVPRLTDQRDTGWH